MKLLLTKPGLNCRKTNISTRTVLVRYTPPSYTPGATELEALNRLGTTVLSDSVNPLAASHCSLETVYAALQITAPGDLKNAVSKAFAFRDCDPIYKSSQQPHLSCQLDKALANIASMQAPSIQGRVTVELDPRLAASQEAMLTRARALLSQLAESGVPKDKVLLQLPGTWAGIQAARILEEKREATVMVSQIFSFAQVKAAAEAGASVVSINIAAVQGYYRSHPGLVRNPRGPREDAGTPSTFDPACELVRRAFAYCRQHHAAKTRILVTGVMRVEDAMALGGVDFMVLPDRVATDLASAPTAVGYNDGMSGSSGVSVETERGIDNVMDADFSKETGVMSEAGFKESLGMAGSDLLSREMADKSKALERIMPLVEHMVMGVD